VFRGESRPIASETEDLFARYLIDRLPPGTVIYVNQTMTTVNRDVRLRVKPDLVIVKNGIISAILDLKMDLGYQRSAFPTYWIGRDQQLQCLHNQKVSMYVKTDTWPQRKELTFGDHARLFYVLVSDQNINSEQLGIVLNMRGTMQCSDLVVLTQGAHPNMYGVTIDEAFKRITINHHDFDCLEKALTQEGA
jgi:hypothetical protein